MKTLIANNIEIPKFLDSMVKTIRAVVYVRVSSDEQAKKEFSIPKIQIPECLKLIKESGWRFVKTYIDNGYACNTFLKRSELQRMLTEDIDTYDVVVIWSFDRLIGDDENTRGRIYNILDKNKKQITSVRQKMEIVSSEEYDPKSLNVAQLRQINSLGVTYDRKIRRERFMESRNKTVKAGKHIVEAPYGYKIIREIDSKDGRRTIGYRTIDGEESPILKRIFKERSEGNSGRKIALALNSDGIKTRNGKEWTGARIYQILRNPFSCGYIIWNKTQHRRFGDDSVLTPLPETRWQYLLVDEKREKYYKTIIDKKLFDICQEITRKNKSLKGKASYSKNVLAGLLKCPFCGASMVETSFYKIKTPPYHIGYYACIENHSKGKCSSRKYRAWPIREVVLNKVEEYLKDPEQLKEYQSKTRNNRVEEKEKELVNYENRMRKMEKRIYSLNLKYIDGKIREDYYKDLLDGLEKGEVSLRNTILGIKEEIKEYSKREQTFYKMKDLGRNFQKRFMNLGDQKKKQILHSLVKEVLLRKEGKIDILFRI